MNKSRGFLPLLIPSATVFISSFCIMVLELVASRLIARYLGSSLYTWTAVIGVVLAGITIGNYLGGRIADRFNARKALAVLFALSSAACVITVILNNLIGDWLWLWRFSWPARTFSHVSIVFLLPSVLLGTISPVVAKMALDRGLATGRTVGDIYAWGAAGSIAGTFAAGYFLIAAMGTVAIIWTVGGTLLVMALLYWRPLWPGCIWAVVFLCALLLAVLPVEWCEKASAAVALREKPDPKILYQDESQYCYIAVEQITEHPDKRAFMQDKLMHSKMIMGDILDLQYSYAQIYAAVTKRLTEKNQKISALVIGGGGYVYPRYIQKVWPGSSVDVVEIDPGVTKAAIEGLGLSPDTTIKTITMDARNYIDELLENKRNGREIPKYDFIYEDAINDYSVPYQLTTRQFNDKIVQTLTDNGVYMVNLIDIYESGLFLGAIVKTLRQTFPYLYVVAEEGFRSSRNTFVVIASHRQINLDDLALEKPVEGLELWVLNDAEIEALVDKTGGIILTDDYVPVENLLAPVVRKSATDLLVAEYRDHALEFKRQGELDQAITRYRQMLQLDPTHSIECYNEIALMLAAQGKTEECVETLRKALDYDEKAGLNSNMANIYFSLGVALKKLGKNDRARTQFDLAIAGYRQFLEKDPKSIKTLVRMGDALAESARFAEAARYFQKAVVLNPTILENHVKTIQAMQFAGQIDSAIEHTTRAIQFFTRHNQKQIAEPLQQYLQMLQFRKFQQQQQKKPD